MTEPFPQASPADLVEQATPVGDDEVDEVSDAPLETDPADFQEQHQSVPVDDDER